MNVPPHLRRPKVGIPAENSSGAHQDQHSGEDEPEDLFDAIRRRVQAIRDLGDTDSPKKAAGSQNGKLDGAAAHRHEKLEDVSNGPSKSQKATPSEAVSHNDRLRVEEAERESKQKTQIQLKTKAKGLRTERASLAADLEMIQKTQAEEHSKKKTKVEKEIEDLTTRLGMIKTDLLKVKDDEESGKRKIQNQLDMSSKKIETATDCQKKLKEAEKQYHRQLDIIAQNLTKNVAAYQDSEKNLKELERERKRLETKLESLVQLAEDTRKELQAGKEDINAKLASNQLLLKSIDRGAEHGKTEEELSLERQIREMDTQLQENKSECGRLSEEISGLNDRISQYSSTSKTAEKHPSSHPHGSNGVSTPKEKTPEKAENQVVFKHWPVPAERNNPASVPVRRARLSNLPKDSTYHSILSLVWGGAIECLLYSSGDDSAWVLFKYGDGCNNFLSDTKEGIKVPDSIPPRVVTVSQGLKPEPVHPVLQKHYDGGATRCIRVSGFPATFDSKAARQLALQNGRKVDEIVARGINKSVRFSFASTIDAIKFKAELVKSKEYPDLKVDWVRDPCEEAIGPH